MLPDIEDLASQYIPLRLIKIYKHSYLFLHFEIRYKNHKNYKNYKNPRWIDKLFEICKSVKIHLHTNDHICFINHRKINKTKFKFYKVTNLKLKKISKIEDEQQYNHILHIEIVRPGSFDFH